MITPAACRQRRRERETEGERARELLFAQSVRNSGSNFKQKHEKDKWRK
jgi:hypothetical protein